MASRKQTGRFKAKSNGDEYVYRATSRYNADRRSGESEMQWYRRLAKVADQRLVELEALSHDKHFEGVEKMAYGMAMKDIKKWGGNKRFNIAPPSDPRQLIEKTMDIKYFLESPTSLKSGIVESYQRRADKLNELYGTDLKWQDLADYFERGVSARAARTAGGGGGTEASKTALRAIARIQKIRKDIVDKVESNENVTMPTPLTDAAIALLDNKTVPQFLKLSDAEKAEIKKRLKQGQKKGRKK